MRSAGSFTRQGASSAPSTPEPKAFGLWTPTGEMHLLERTVKLACYDRVCENMRTSGPQKAKKIPGGKQAFRPGIILWLSPDALHPDWRLLAAGQKRNDSILDCFFKRQREAASLSSRAISAGEGSREIISLVGCGAKPRLCSSYASGRRTVPISSPSRTLRMLSGWNRPNTRTMGTLFSAQRAKAAASITFRRISWAFS